MSNHFFPDLDTTVMINGVPAHYDETAMLALTPRVNGAGSVTLSGTIANGDVITLTLTSKLFTGGSLAITATAVTGDSAAMLADRLAANFNANTTLQKLGVYANSDPTAGKVDIIWPGPLGAFVTLSIASTGAEGYSVVQITGGSGPIIPTADFNFVYNKSIVQLRDGRSKQLSNDALTQLLASGPQPIK